LPTQIRGPPLASSAAVNTSGGVSPVVPKPRRAAKSAAAAFSAAVGCAGTTILPLMKSAMPSPLVSTSIQPVANASETRSAAQAIPIAANIASTASGFVRHILSINL
jgi:hypothetical protein